MQQPKVQQLLRLPEVIRRTGLSRSWLYKAVSEGGFPRYHKVGRATVWDARAVDAWIAAQVGSGSTSGEASK